MSICIVFVPMLLLPGVAHYLFTPLAEAIVYAMLSSYFLSRTLIPTLAMYLLRGAQSTGATGASNAGIAGGERKPNRFERFQKRFESPVRGITRAVSGHARRHAATFACIYRGVPGVLCGFTRIGPVPGTRFLPQIDSGQIKLHMRAKTGTPDRANRGDCRSGLKPAYAAR